MIKERLKCPQCGKVLFRGYSAAIISVTCPCGCTIDLKHRQKHSQKEVDKKHAR